MDKETGNEAVVQEADAADTQTSDNTASEKEHGGVEHWKEMAKTWEKRAKDNQKETSELKTTIANLKEVNKAAVDEAVAELNKKIQLGTLETVRLSAALEYGISKEDAEMFLTGGTAEEIEKQAKRLSEKLSQQFYKPESSLPVRKTGQSPAGGSLKSGFDAWERRNKK